jgi:NADPH:quinone reductase-like Zn-dependent oxidoreductase
MPTFTAIATTALNTIEAIQLPVPSLAANEVVIEINYGSLMAFDLYQVDYGFFVQDYPNVIGIGGSGKVKRVGEGVKDLKEGDRVGVGLTGEKRMTNVCY